MKFKVIFISFNILIVFSFLMIFLFPVFMLGSEYALQFWQDSWYIAIIFILILSAINGLFFANRKVLSLLETENWPELKILLEDYIFVRKKIRKMYIRMYISTCIATGSAADIRKLEVEMRSSNPKALRVWALQLGLPYLLENDPAEMKKYFGEFLHTGTEDSGWISWNYCFSLLLLKETEDAVERLKLLSAEKKDPLLRLSSMYMLSPFQSDDDVKAVLEQGRNELKQKMSRELFTKELEKQKDNVQMLFLTKIFKEAVDWLYD